MWCFWSAKGGVGCTVVAAGVALALAETRPTLLVDLGGDLPAVLGCRAEGPGLVDWMAAPAPPPDALSRLEVAVTSNLSLLPLSGPGGLVEPNEEVRPPDRWSEPFELLSRVIALDHREVIVDLGQRVRPGSSVTDDPARVDVVARLLALASRSTLVTRPCALAVRAAEEHPPPDDVIVVGRQTRVLDAGDVQRALGAPVAASVRWDPAIGRAVDAGLVTAGTPRSLRVLGSLLPVPAS